MAFLTAEQKKEQGLVHAGFDHAWMIRLLLIRILARNIILRHLVCANFPLVSVPGVLHPLYHVRTHEVPQEDRKSTRLNSSHSQISYAVFCLKKKKYKYIKN